MIGWLRCIYLLRHSELRHYLSEHYKELVIIKEIKQRFSTAKLIRGVQIIAYKKEYLHLGQNVTIRHGTIVAFGDRGNGFGHIHIGDETWIGEFNNLRASGEGGDIKIGRHCMISQFCTLVGSNHSTFRSQLINEQGIDQSRLGVILEDDVWLGAGVAIVPGVRIGEGAVIGANATVTKSVPPYEIWAGVPARKIGVRK